ncbi:MAG: 5'/3'-nucleotidase SurE [Candidatus Latescibacterota bacterium]
MPKLLMLTNDDGIDAKGIKALEASLDGLGDIIVVAPAAEQSASSHSLTLGREILAEKIDEWHYRISGTPTDCVLLAVQGFLKQKPDYLISGINHGPNMGEDVTYSGTVSVAIEGMILGIPSIAISSLQRSMNSADETARIARAVVESMMQYGLSQGALLNVNIPDPEIAPIAGVKITKLGSRAYENMLEAKVESENRMTYLFGGDDPIWTDDDGTDIAAIRKSMVSVTPLHLGLTDYKAIVEMEKWRFRL